MFEIDEWIATGYFRGEDPRMDCPHCNRLLYSRRKKICDFCGGEIPAEMLFTAEEIAAQNEESRQMDLQRERERKTAEEGREQTSSGMWGMPPFGLPSFDAESSDGGSSDCSSD